MNAQHKLRLAEIDKSLKELETEIGSQTKDNKKRVQLLVEELMIVMGRKSLDYIGSFNEILYFLERVKVDG